MSQMRSTSRHRLLAAAAFALLASGCASVSPNRSFGPVATLATTRLGAEARLLRTEEDARAGRRDRDKAARAAASR